MVFYRDQPPIPVECEAGGERVDGSTNLWTTIRGIGSSQREFVIQLQHNTTQFPDLWGHITAVQNNLYIL